MARVAAQLSGEDGIGLTRQYVGMLRGGERAQPSLQATSALAEAFAELARRSGHVCEPVELLVFLAGRSPIDPLAALRTASDQPRTPTERSESEGDLAPAVLARRTAGGEGETTPAALRALIEELSRPEAEPARRKLARLLRRSDQPRSDQP